MKILSPLRFSWLAVLAFCASAANAAPVQMVEFTYVGGPGGKLRIWESTKDAPVELQKVRFEGDPLGTAVDSSYGPAEFERLQRARAPETVVRYRGMSAMDFLPAADFDLRSGGAIEVGYLASLTKRAVVLTTMVWDPAKERWYFEYRAPRAPSGAPVYRLKTVQVNLKVQPVVGVVGVESLVGRDEDGRSVTLEPAR